MFVEVAAYDTSARIGDMAASMEEKPLEGAQPVEVLHGMLSLLPTRVPGTVTADASLDLGVPSGFTDSSRQAGIPNPSVSFEGMSQVDQVKANGFIPVPPDTVGDVGPNHYVQAVNVALAVYDKKGKILMPATPLGMVWEDFAISDCAGDGGDPIVLYDQFEDRWILEQLTLGCLNTDGGDCYTCVAVSTSGDPTGSYYRYAFKAQQDPSDPSRTVLPDYPKLSVWSDSYILTTRDFGISSIGTSVYAFEKGPMVAGEPNPGILQFSLDFEVYGPLIGDALIMLSADIDGDDLPPPGSPVPILSVQDDLFGDAQFDALNVWELFVDWSQNSGSLQFKESLRVTPFTTFYIPCFGEDGDNNCIPQPGVPPTQYLDALSFFLMYRLAYRNFGCYESMVVTQAVEARPGVVGKRWYEIRRDKGEYSIEQQSTFSPDDGVNRWMGSIAQDGAGNIALGYSVSNAVDVFPGIQYTGRLADDPPNEMALGEAVLAYGSGVQTTQVSRWGDYSSMNIDPTDDCTFWYTNEYYTSTGQAVGELINILNNRTDLGRFYQTRIGSFTLPGCMQDKKRNMCGKGKGKSTKGKSTKGKSTKGKGTMHHEHIRHLMKGIH
jgi:hypothetical protein